MIKALTVAVYFAIFCLADKIYKGNQAAITGKKMAFAVSGQNVFSPYFASCVNGELVLKSGGGFIVKPAAAKTGKPCEIRFYTMAEFLKMGVS